MPVSTPIRSPVWALVPLAALLLTSPDANANVRGLSLPELVELSDRIVLGTVSRLHRVSGLLIAEVAVSETLKGAPLVPTVYFLAQPTWICDVTEAEAGETALLFLTSSDGSVELQELPPGDGDFKKAPRGFRKKLDRLRGEAPFFLVTQAGRGHMPLRMVGDQQLATVWTGDVRLPAGVATFPGPEPEYSFIRSVPFLALRDLIFDAVRSSSGSEPQNDQMQERTRPAQTSKPRH